MKRLTLFIALLFLVFLSASSQESKVAVNHEGKDFRMLKHTWKAQWITHPTASTLDYGVFLFRRTFKLQTLPDTLIIHLSADNRYRLYVNGKYITYGPSAGDIDNYRYESIDIAAYLQLGTNVIAAEVVNFGEYRRAAQQTFQTAFILQAESDQMHDLNIDTGTGTWKVSRNKAYQGIPFVSDSLGAYYAAGPGEKIAASAYPWGWKGLNYDDNSWPDPKPGTVEFAVGRGFLYGSTWFLVPRQIPLMEERKERFEQVVRSGGLEDAMAFIKEDQSTVIPPDSKVSILIDHKFHTTGFPELRISKGKGARIKITYAEALYLPWSSGELRTEGHYDAYDRKRNRNETEGKEIEGYYDLIYPGGGEDRLFRPLSRKTFRFVQFDIQTAGQELVLEDYCHVYAGYPFREKASFDSDRNELQAIWDAAWRTLVNSSEEQFYDPYFEQLQYIGDTRIEALVSIYVSGDDRLMRKAIQQFDDSRLPNGLTQSRYPSYIVQIIPPYSLLWIGMIHDYYMYRNDDQFVQSFLPGIRSVLDWFIRRVDDSGMATGLEWWNFTDWSEGFPNGIPPGADDGYSANINLQFVSALQQAAEIFEHFELLTEARRYRKLSQQIQTSVLENCYDENRGLIAETPDKEVFSQHTNIWAILTNTIAKGSQEQVMRILLKDTSLIQSTIYFKFYLFRALQKSGLGDLYLSMLGPWEKMLAKGMTTFGEKDGIMRSECHAWSASPCFDFLHTVAGIHPLEPGFRSVGIAPNFGELKELKVSFPHPDGMLILELKMEEKKGLTGTITLPPNVHGELSWKGKKHELYSGNNTISAW